MSIFNPVLLIEEVKKRPGIYKTEQSSDRDEKLMLWKEIGAVIYHNWADFNKATAYDRVLQLQRKWRSLRDAYNRELRARKSGVRVNRRVYRYFQRMSFLGGFEGTVNENIDDIDANEILSMNENSNNLLEEEPPIKPIILKRVRKKKKKRKPSVETTPAMPEEVEVPAPTEVTEQDADSDRLFLLSFLPEMKVLPVHIKMWVRAQVANVMQEAVTCSFTKAKPGNKKDKKEGSQASQSQKSGSSSSSSSSSSSTSN